MWPNREYRCKYTWQTNGINKTAWSDRLDHCWQLGFHWHRRGIEPVFKALNCFTMQLLHSAPILLLLHMIDYHSIFLFFEEFFFNFCVCVWGGGSIWWDRRGYYGVSNVALVLLIKYIRYMYILKGLQLNSPKGVKGIKNAMDPTVFSKFAFHISPFRAMICENAHCMYGIRTVLSSGVIKSIHFKSSIRFITNVDVSVISRFCLVKRFFGVVQEIIEYQIKTV